MPTATLYHNPRCSKSRQTLALLEEHKIELSIIEYLNTPPSVDDIKHILKLLRLTPREIMRKAEEDYQANDLNNLNLTDDALIEGIHQHPKIMQRPIVLYNGKAAIGRPPEAILEIL